VHVSGLRKGRHNHQVERELERMMNAAGVDARAENIDAPRAFRGAFRTRGHRGFVIITARDTAQADSICAALNGQTPSYAAVNVLGRGPLRAARAEIDCL